MADYNLPYTGDQTAEYLAKARDFSGVPLDDGLYAGAKTYTTYDQYLNDTGALFKLNPAVSLGYAINVALYPNAKDDLNLIPYTSFESASTEAIDEFNNVTAPAAIAGFEADGVNAISDFNDDGTAAINSFNSNGQDAIDNLVYVAGYQNVGVFGIGETVQSAQETLTYNGEEFNTTAGPFPYVTDGATPTADSADWYNVTLEARKTVARSLNELDVSVTYATPGTVIAKIIYDASQQASYYVPAGAIGKTIVSVVGSVLNTTVDGPYQLTDIIPQSTNTDDYASFGSNVADPISLIGHVAGSVATVNAPVIVNVDSMYKVTVDITTTDEGYVKLLFDGVDAIYGDQPNGLWFSDVAILADGTENNRVLTTNLYFFSLVTSSTAYSTLSIETSLEWGGTVTGITVEEITPTETGLKITASDGVGRNNPVGVKTTALNRGDVALGDKATLGSMFYDAVSPTPAFNTALGSRALSININGDQNSAGGAFALQSNEGSNSSAWGYSCFKLATKGQENSGYGYKAGTTVTTGYQNCLYGFWSGVGIKTGYGNSHFGWKQNTTGGDLSLSSFFGWRCGSYLLSGTNATIMGANAGRAASGQAVGNFNYITTFGSESNAWGNKATTLGFQANAGTEATPRDNAMALGPNSTASGDLSHAVGYLSVATETRSLAVGEEADCDSEQGIALGGLTEAKGGLGVTAIGSRSGIGFLGTLNTFLGRFAGVQVVAYQNCTILGALAVVTGSNQVQLGDSATTTYAFGAVQDRSDMRDKMDFKSITDAHIAFFMEIEWQRYRMDYRESYRDVDDTGKITYAEKDGTRSGSRYHIGAVAQHVEELMIKHGIDFAGLQHHSVAGGQDVYSIGYQEFIGLQGEIIQRQEKRLLSIESRLVAAGI